MKPKKTKLKVATYQAVAAGILAAGMAASPTQAADASDALLRKLVDKGILTTKEADELQTENREAAKKTVVNGLGLPEWVTSLRFYGDFRGRFEEQTAENDQYTGRPRYRYRVRLGLQASMWENFEVGVRLASGNPQFNPGGTLVGGAPITANQDLNSLESRKFIWIDAAYGRWSPIKNDDWTLTGTVGKFDNPFLLSNMIYDYDIVPEGAALQGSYNINKQHALKAVGAVFVLDELNQSGANRTNPSHDPYLIGGQAIWEAKWTPKFETLLNGAIMSIDSKDSLSALSQPFYNSGNTRDPVTGVLVENYNPIIGTAAATYKFPQIPIYAAKDFPVKVAGEYMYNTAVEDNNIGWRVGFTLGKAAKRNTWEINYRYQELEADAWFDALVDDDNGAFYGSPDLLGKIPARQLAGTGKLNGWFGGTNLKGHQVVAVYQLTDFLNFTFIYYYNDLILKTRGQDSSAQHFMAELNWKF